MLPGGNLADEAAVEAAGRACSCPLTESVMSMGLFGWVDRRVSSCGVAMGVLPREGVCPGKPAGMGIFRWSLAVGETETDSAVVELSARAGGGASPTLTKSPIIWETPARRASLMASTAPSPISFRSGVGDIEGESKRGKARERWCGWTRRSCSAARRRDTMSCSSLGTSAVQHASSVGFCAAHPEAWRDYPTTS